MSNNASIAADIAEMNRLMKVYATFDAESLIAKLLNAEIDRLSDVIDAALKVETPDLVTCLIPAGGMALTAEQVEDVEALVATANPYSAPAARLRALFPATEPAEDAKPCGSNSITLGWCKLTARHEGLHTNGTYLWGTPSEPDPPAPSEPAEERCQSVSIFRERCALVPGHDGRHAANGCAWGYPPAPAEPAEEETKAERWTVSTTYRAAGPFETSDDKVRIDRFADAWRASGYEVTVTPVAEGEERTCTQCPDYAHGGDGCDLDPSPVVPAPTETGPWHDISEAPTHLTLVDRVGDKWTYDGDNWVTPETAILPVLYINRKYAPFVAAEEG
ncbi:hypothetical protein [Rhodococcus qingshengii]|uniref:Uncharacterized protein n=1 Tax=Rhodococcus qingshengii TaxID=334542 RepID=A0A2A5JE45_RHOSG|nr:hypothetical protein [Rhodococcus qingshengii]PCK27835.1 hypothetical protein CHR55_10145 [Rhodococcus qingshengii]